MALKINSTNSGIRSGDTASESLVLPHVINPAELNPQVVAYWQGQLDPAFTATWRANRTTGYGTLIEMRGKTRGYAQDGTAANNTDVSLINPYQKNVTARVEYRYVISTNTVDVKFSYPTSYTKNDAIWILTNEVTWTGLAPDLLTASFSIFWRTTAADSVTPSYEFLINGQSAATLGGTATETQSVVQNGPYTYVEGNPVLTTKTHTGDATNLQGYSIYWTSFGYGRSDTVDQFVLGDRVWIKGFATGASLPASTKFTSGTTFAGIVKDGTLTGTSTRANVYIYDRDGSLSGTVTNRGLGGVTTAIPTTQPLITPDSPSYWDWGIPSSGVYPAPGSGIYVPGRQPIINVTVGYYVTDDYVVPNYVLDDAFAALTSLSTDLGLIKGGQASLVATSQVTVDSTFRRDFEAALFNTATVTTQADLVLGGTAALASSADLSTTGNYLLSVTHDFAAVATVLAQPADTIEASSTLSTVASLATTSTLTVGLQATLSSQITVTATANLTQDLQAQLSAEFTTYNNLGRLILVNEPFVYTWDELQDWMEWNRSDKWTLPDGVNLVAFDTQVALGGTQISGAAALSTTASLATTATHLRLAEAAVSAEAALAASADLVKDAQATLTAVSTVTCLALRVQEIFMSAFGQATLTCQADLVFVVSVPLSVTATATILGGIRYLTPQANLAVTGATLTSLSVRFTGSQALLSSQFTIASTITVSTYERHRTFDVLPESRRIRVLAEPRTIVVPEQTRSIRVPVPPLIISTIERQI